MKTRTRLIFSCLFLTALTFHIEAQEPITIGEKHAFQSEIIGETFMLWVHLPLTTF